MSTSNAAPRTVRRSSEPFLNCIQSERVNRQTGTTVRTIDTQSMLAPSRRDPNRESWVTWCVEHACIVFHRNKTTATYASVRPASWCARCAQMTKQEIQLTAVFGSGGKVHVHRTGCRQALTGRYPFDVSASSGQQALQRIWDGYGNHSWEVDGPLPRL